MVFGIHFGDDFLDDTVGADNKSHPVGSHVAAAVHAFLDPSPKGFMHRFVLVADQVKGKLKFGNEFLMRSRRVTANAQDLVTGLEQALVMIPEAAGFGRATGRIVFGIEIKDQSLAFEFMEAADFSVLIGGLKGRGWIADLGSGHIRGVWGSRFRKEGRRVGSFDHQGEAMDSGITRFVPNKQFQGLVSKRYAFVNGHA